MGEGECVYYLESSLTANEYLSQLKRTFRSPFLIYDERVCGIIIGPFFSVAYHSPHEWNRRITSECNRAWGYVKEVDGKASVTFMRGKGLLSPFWLVFCTLLWYAVLSLKFGHEPVLLLASFGISAASCLVTAFQSIITDAGETGFHETTRLLLQPEEYYG